MKAIPNNSGGQIVQTDFSADETKCSAILCVLPSLQIPDKRRDPLYLEAINREAARIIAELNQRNLRDQRDLRKSRDCVFENYDKPRMKELPHGNFTVCDYWYFLRAPDNYHLEYDGHYYSVPYSCHGKPALLKASMSEIRICDENNRLLCTHPRSYKDFPRYITEESHMPSEHQYYKELILKCNKK